MKIKIFLPLLLLFLSNTVVMFSQANAGENQEICQTQTNLNAELPTGFTGEWSINSGNCNFENKFSNTTLITNIMLGENILKWTISDGSTSDFDYVYITNNKTNIANTAGDEEICKNYNPLNANLLGTGETGLWTVVAGSGIIENETINATNVTELSLGINKFEWKITKGICFSKDTITITSDIVTAYAGTDETTCNDFTNLMANNPINGTGTWTVVNSNANPVFGNINSPSTTITSLGTNGNSLQWTVTNSTCTAHANIIITNNKPTTSVTGINKTICTNTTNLSANNPTEGEGIWSVVYGSGSFSHINYYNTQVSSIDVGSNTYKWSITKNGCISEDEIEIYYDYFIADAGEDDETCTNSYTLLGNNLPGTTGLWRVTGGSGTFANENLYNTEVNGLVNGVNTFEWKLTRGNCVHTDYVVITQNTASTADAGSNKETCNGTTSLSATEPAIGTGSWSLVSGTGIFANSLQSNTFVSDISSNVNNTYRWKVSYAQCSTSDDVIVINNFVSTNAGSDQIVCGTATSLSANPLQTGETGIWEVLEGGSTVTNINLYNSAVENLASGDNRFKWTISKGTCSVSDEVEVVNNKYYASASISGPSEICNDYSSIIGNTPPSGGIGFWQIQTGTGIFDNSNDNSTIVRNLSIGENILRWVILKDACENFSNIILNRNTVFADAGADASVCENNATLSAVPVNIGEIGVWSVTSGSGVVLDVNDNNSEVTNLNLGTNTFTWTVSGNNCVAEDNVIITNNKFNTNAGANQQICISNTSLSALNIGYGYWEVFEGEGSFSSPSNRNTDVSNIPNNSFNTYRWHAFKNGCTDTDDVNVTNNLIIANAGTDFSVCNNTATLNAENPTSGSGTWTNQVGAGIFADVNSPSTEVTGLNLDINTYRWTVENLTCISYDDVSIYNNHISVSAGPNQEICNDFTQLSGGQPPIGETGLWEIVDGFVIFENENLYNTNITNIQNGINTLKWTINNSGCTSNEGEVIINNKGFDADAGDDQVLEDFVTSTYLNSVLPEEATAYWTLVGGYGDITDIYDTNTEVTNMETGINQFLWFVSKNGCTSQDVVNITVVNFTANAGVDRIICTNSVKLSATDYSGTPQVWSIIEGAGDFDDPNSYNTWVRNIGEGINTYRWTVTQNGATAYDEVIITRVIANAGDNQVLSVPQTTLSGNIPPNNCTGNWDLVYGSANISSNTLYNTEVNNLNNGKNTFKWTITTPECILSDYVDVIYDNTISILNNDNTFQVYPNPNNGTFIIRNNDSIEYNALIYNITGKIINNEFNITEKNKQLSISNHANGIYFLKITKNGKENTIKIVKK